MAPAARRITLGADKGYDVAGFIAALRTRRVTPHVAVDGRVSKLGVRRGSGVDARTTRHAGYAASPARAQNGSRRCSAGSRDPPACGRPGNRGRERVGWQFDLTVTTYNLIRLPRLLAPAPAMTTRDTQPTAPNRVASPQLTCKSGRRSVKESRTEMINPQLSAFFSSLLELGRIRRAPSRRRAGRRTGAFAVELEQAGFSRPRRRPRSGGGCAACSRRASAGLRPRRAWPSATRARTRVRPRSEPSSVPRDGDPRRKHLTWYYDWERDRAGTFPRP